MAKWKKIDCATHSRLSKMDSAQWEKNNVFGLRMTFKDGKKQCWRMVKK